MLHPIQRVVVPFFLRLFWIKEVRGLENMPKDGRFIVTPSHGSFIDDWIMPVFVISMIDKELHMYVNKNYWKNPLFALYMNHHKCIPVEVHDAKDKKEVNQRAFEKALEYLNNNEPICIYPEGHRSPDGELQKGKFGAAKLALHAKAPVLPVGLVNTFDVWPKAKKFPKIKRIVKVNIGKPIYFEKYYKTKDKKDTLKKATRTMMEEIAKLMNKKYRY